MNITKGVVVAAVVAFTGSPALAADISYSRLLNAMNEPANHLMQWKNYASHNYSRLAQINAGNAGDLKVKFMTPFANGLNRTTEQFIPMVEDGFMYVGTGEGRMFKLDVRSGYQAPVVWMHNPEQNMELGRGRARGAALLGDSIYNVLNLDGRLIRLNKDTGEVLFDVNVKSDTLAPLEYGRGPGNNMEASRGEAFSATPVALEDKIIVQQARSGGVRSWVGAHDAETGEVLWRWWVVPGPGTPGHETWTDDWNAYLAGGGSVFNSGSYDPDTNLYIVGTGDPSPWGNPEFRPGDNLYTLSTVGIDADTGELRWFFQEIANEAWDYDAVGVKQLYDIEVAGQMQNVLGTWSRNGYHYTLNRNNGDFVFAEAFVPVVTWSGGLDPKTGKALLYDPNVDLQPYGGFSQRFGDITTGLDVCPHHGGTPTYWPPSFDQANMISYQAGAHTPCADYAVTAQLPEEVHWGKSTGGTWSHTRHAETFGFVRGIDVRTGKVVKETIMQYPNSNGVLATAGGVLLTSQIDGKIMALNADTMAEIWSFYTHKVPNAGLVTYMAGGKQYVAAMLGGRMRSDFRRAGFTPELDTVRLMGEYNTGILVVFGL